MDNNKMDFEEMTKSEENKPTIKVVDINLGTAMDWIALALAITAFAFAITHYWR